MYIYLNEHTKISEVDTFDVYADPETIVYVTWKSVILSSVLITEAGQKGSSTKAVANVPMTKLKNYPGTHEIVTYAVDLKTGQTSNASSAYYTVK